MVKTVQINIQKFNTILNIDYRFDANINKF